MREKRWSVEKKISDVARTAHIGEDLSLVKSEDPVGVQTMNKRTLME